MQFPNVEEFSLPYCSHLTERVLHSLLKLKKLRVLNLTGSVLPQSLALLTHLKTIKKINLSETNITHHELKLLIESMTQKMDIYLYKCANLIAEDLEQLAQNHSHVFLYGKNA